MTWTTLHRNTSRIGTPFQQDCRLKFGSSSLNLLGIHLKTLGSSSPQISSLNLETAAAAASYQSATQRIDATKSIIVNTSPLSSFEKYCTVVNCSSKVNSEFDRKVKLLLKPCKTQGLRTTVWTLNCSILKDSTFDTSVNKCQRKIQAPGSIQALPFTESLIGALSFDSQLKTQVWIK
jgi:hypothetical protein